MTFLLTALSFIVIFSVLVLIHEWGHFFVARKAGIKVEEFGFGLPPRIWGVKKGETLYSINAIPFGGFVKLLGEDSRDPKMQKDKRSFISRSPRVRLAVVIAGVVMNYLLAILLLTTGFIFGIQPLILSGDDVLASIADGIIKTSQGVIVKEVTADLPGAQAGIKVDDIIISVDGREDPSNEQLQAVTANADGKTHIFEIIRSGEAMQIQIAADPGKSFGITPYDTVFLPRVAIHAVKTGSESEAAGLKSGDVILSINDQPIYFIDDYEAAVTASTSLEFQVSRNYKTEKIFVSSPKKDTVIISSVLPDTPAEKAGLKSGDVIVALDDNSVSSPEEVVATTKIRILKDGAKEIKYQVNRNNETMFFVVQPQESGLIGVGLSQIQSFENSELSVYSTDSAASVLKIEDVSYPFWIAPVKAIEESGRLAVLTVEMFGNVVRSVFTKLAVPEGVSGPVGIAQLTYVFVQEGVLSLMRFMALLSLSLAIINILPFPALDGGRLFFILWEIVTGRRVGAIFESVTHSIGFVLLMFLIVAVTYSDILRLFL